MNILSLALACLIGLSATAEAQPSRPADNSSLFSLLEQLQSQSREVEIQKFEFSSTNEKLRQEEAIFRFGGTLEFSSLEQDPVPTSPFASNKKSEKTYKLGLSRLWPVGIQMELSYALTDSFTSFPARDSFSYLSPALQLDLKTSLTQDLIYGRYRFQEKAIQANRKSLELEQQINSKQLVLQGLLQFSQFLEKKGDLKLQSRLCQKIRTQTAKLSRKRKTRSVSQRDYLLSQRELNQCESSIISIENSILEAEAQFQTLYGFSPNDHVKFKIESLYDELKQAYLDNRATNLKTAPKTLSESAEEVLLLSSKLQASELKGAELSAKSRMNLSLGLSTGIMGLDENLDRAHDDLQTSQYPFIQINLSLDFPFTNPASEAERLREFFTSESLRLKRKLALEKNNSRIEILEVTLEKDQSIYLKNLKNISLSENILNEARKDFSNGRIDFFSLTEFNKGLISAQKSLSTQRLKVILGFIEYLDDRRFFENILAKAGSHEI